MISLVIPSRDFSKPLRFLRKWNKMSRRATLRLRYLPVSHHSKPFCSSSYDADHHQAHFGNAKGSRCGGWGAGKPDLAYDKDRDFSTCREWSILFKHENCLFTRDRNMCAVLSITNCCLQTISRKIRDKYRNSALSNAGESSKRDPLSLESMNKVDGFWCLFLDRQRTGCMHDLTLPAALGHTLTALSYGEWNIRSQLDQGLSFRGK
jgi:hypothetical protein